MPRAKQLLDIFIIMPTYNKRKNLPLFVQRVGKFLKGVKYGLIILASTRQPKPR
ncbi:MAG: hypothetical protein ACETWO_05245 [Candidatus Hadarchaeaceae archaeon]|nr:hypothetical protein [Hadesarchaea archaeon]MDH5685326.1 hypothetical protein [Hadesarchaea archaeon]